MFKILCLMTIILITMVMEIMIMVTEMAIAVTIIITVMEIVTVLNAHATGDGRKSRNALPGKGISTSVIAGIEIPAALIN